MARRPARRARMLAWLLLCAMLPGAVPAEALPHGRAAMGWAGPAEPRGEAQKGGDPAAGPVPTSSGAARPGSAPAGEIDSRVGRRPARTAAQADTLELVVVSQRPWTPAVTVVVSFAGGYGDDPPGSEGRTWLLGMLLERTARARLAETGAAADIEVEDARTWVTLLATTGDWAAAYRILMRALLEDPLDPALAGETRADLSAQVFFQRGAPVRTFELEAGRMLLGAERARAPMGTPSSVNGITVEALEAARGRIYRSGHARVALMGAVAADDAASVVGAHRTLATRQEQAWIVEGEPLPSRSTGRAWEVGGRHAVTDEITNSWVRIAYPFSGATARRSMEFVAHLMREELVIDPPAPGLISRRVDVRELPGGPVLLVTIAAAWPTARAWEQRVTDVVNRLSADPPSPDLLNRRHRSFRSAKALELADPEQEGRRLLAEAEVTGELGELLAPWQVPSPEDIQRAVADLGEPRVLVYGPGGPSS